MAGGRSAMKVTTVRFGVDLWRLIEAEAATAGVSASQYIREASLARAAAAAAARGEDPLGVLAGPSGTPAKGGSEKQADQRGIAGSLRRRAAEIRLEGKAATAESKQAMRRANQLREEGKALRRGRNSSVPSRRKAEPTPGLSPDTPGRNHPK